jgi:hypothetical protein
MSIPRMSRASWLGILLGVAFIVFMSLTIAFDPGGKNPPVTPAKSAHPAGTSTTSAVPSRQLRVHLKSA